MKSSEVIKAIKIGYKMKRAILIEGAPGAGKSDTVRQACKELGEELKTKFECRDVRLPLMDPVDIHGLPYNDNGFVKWLQPGFLPTKGKGILFLDEIADASPSTKSAALGLVLDRKLGDYVLPEGWSVVAAGNRMKDRAGATRMPTHLNNRFMHIDFEIDHKDWVAWALGADVMTEVVAFIRFRPELLHQFDPTKNEKAFATPRTWEFVSDLLKQTPPKEIEFEMIKGTVGEGAAGELVSFLRIFRALPNPDAVLMNPKSAQVPTDPATMYALCGALARKASEQNMDRLVQYANRIPDEFSVLLIRDSLHHCPEAKDTRGYIEWCSKHSEVLI